MCGILGWLSLGPHGRVDIDLLLRMRDSMVHRGPDGEGAWISADRRIGLGFRRLAIVDLSPEANQPMENEDGRIRIVFNGEIYNHLCLRRRLEAAGHRFRTHHSDTESILHAYEEWGVRVVEEIEGMFALAIWDENRDRLFLARDRVGIKPLYFAWTPESFVFASEIKAILGLPAFKRAIEPISVYHYLSFLTTPAPLTMFRGIYKMPAGYRAVIDVSGRMTAERYWDALPGMGEERAEIEKLSGKVLEEFAVHRTRELLDRAIEKRMMSDVPFGVLLSGGIDSSTNVALMSRHMNQPVRTFTVGFSDHEDLNELQHARKIASLFRTDHHEVLVNEEMMREYLPSLIISQDEPIADWVCIPLYFVSRLVRDSGTVVVQVGEGSDEQFAGYRSYLLYLDMYQRFWRHFVRLPNPVKRFFASLADMVTAVHDRHDPHVDVIARAGRNREPFWSGATVFSESRKAMLVRVASLEHLEVPSAMRASGLLPESYDRADTYEIVRSFYDRLDHCAPGRDLLTRMIYSEFKLRLPELLLMRVDKIGMSASIEPRVPFLDHKLVEFTMNVPMSLKVRHGIPKWLLKQAVRGLIPDEVIDRPKMGFGAPMAQWLRGDFGREVAARLGSTRFFDCFPAERGRILDMLDRHRSGRADFALYVWTFYNAVAWFDTWIDGSSGARAA
jgi:asparagine synthase (glutamine-hydrolysing)